MRILSGGIPLRLRARLRGELPGIDLVHAQNAREFWNLLKRESVDAVVLDQRIVLGAPADFLASKDYPVGLLTIYISRKRLPESGLRALLKPGSNISLLHAPVVPDDLLRLLTVELGLSRSRLSGCCPIPLQPSLEKVWREQTELILQRLRFLEELGPEPNVPALRKALASARQLASDLGSFGIYRATLASRTVAHLLLNALAGEGLEQRRVLRLCAALRLMVEHGISATSGPLPTLLLASPDEKFCQLLLGECRLLGWDLRAHTSLAQLIEAADGPQIHALLVDARRPQMLVDRGGYEDIIQDPLASFVISAEPVVGEGRNHYWLNSQQTPYQMLMAVARVQAGPLVSRPPHILHWDEDRVTRALASELLIQSDFSVRSVSQSSEFWQAIEDDPPDLVLISLHLPQMSGLEVTRALRLDENLRHLPVVLLSEYSDSLSQLKAYESGVDDVVLKPFSPRQLLSRISNRISLSKARRNLVDISPVPSRLHARLEQLFLRSHRQSIPVQLVCLRFQAPSEEVFRDCQLALRQHLRGEDVVRRMAPDELLVACLATVNDNPFERVLQICRQRVGDFETARAIFPQDGEDLAALLKLLRQRFAG
jgi:DNA-binding response OmpR family regulator